MRRVGISRNSVRGYLRLQEGKDDLSDKALAVNAYNNEQHDAQTKRHYDLIQHFVAQVRELRRCQEITLYNFVFQKKNPMPNTYT